MPTREKNRLVYGYEARTLTVMTAGHPRYRVTVPIPDWLVRQAESGVYEGDAFVDDVAQELDEALNWPPTYPELEGERPQLGVSIDRGEIKAALPLGLFVQGVQHAKD